MLICFRVFASWTVICKYRVKHLFSSTEAVQSDLLLVFIVLLKDELSNHLRVKKHLGAFGVDFVLVEAVLEDDFQVVVGFDRSIDSLVEIWLPTLSIPYELVVISVEKYLQLVNDACEVDNSDWLLCNDILNFFLSMDDHLSSYFRLLFKSSLHGVHIFLIFLFSIANGKSYLFFKFDRWLDQLLAGFLHLNVLLVNAEVRFWNYSVNSFCLLLYNLLNLVMVNGRHCPPWRLQVQFLSWRSLWRVLFKHIEQLHSGVSLGLNSQVDMLVLIFFLHRGKTLTTSQHFWLHVIVCSAERINIISTRNSINRGIFSFVATRAWDQLLPWCLNLFRDLLTFFFELKKSFHQLYIWFVFFN